MELGVHVVDHPPYSPDLNPIENVWFLVDHRVHTYECPTNATELRAATVKVWNELTDTEIRPFFESMPARFDALRENGGGRTRY